MLRSLTLLTTCLLSTGLCWAGDPVVRVASIDPAQKGGKAVLQQQHPGQSAGPAYVKSMGYVQDRYITDANTVAALEFLIGGRVAMTRNTNIEIKDERSVTGSGESVKRIVLKSGNLWVKADAKQLKQPLEIQTNGGVMGIKGTEFTVETAPDGSTAEVACFESNSEQGGVAIYAPGKEEPLANVKPGEDYKLKIKNAQFVDLSKRTAASGDALREEKKNTTFKDVVGALQMAAGIISQAGSFGSWMGGGGSAFSGMGYASSGLYTAGALLNADQLTTGQQLQMAMSIANQAGGNVPYVPSEVFDIFGRKSNKPQEPKRPDYPFNLSPDSTPDSKQEKSPGALPVLKWDGVKDAKGYVVMVAPDESMNTIIFSDQVKAPDKWEDKVSLNYPSNAKPLQKGSRYYWRVVPVTDDEEPVKKGSQTYFEVSK